MSSVKPDFIYAGAPKAGSTWLFEVLRSHPDIFVPPAKDLHFFDKYYSKGIDWYLQQFGHSGKKVCGELSHDYFTEEEVADRIARHLPDVKLIFCLRDPADLTLSAWRYARNHSNTFDTSFEEYSLLPISVKQIDYVNNLTYFYSRFSDKNILVVFFDDIKEKPEELVRKIYDFLEVNSSFIPPMLFEKVNAAKNSRNLFLTKFAYSLAVFLRKAGLTNLLGKLKSSAIVEKLLYKQAEESSGFLLTEQEINVYKSISESGRKNKKQLENLIGLSTPDNWYS